MDFHRGVDLKAKRSIICAVLSGRVSSCGQNSVLGNFVRICHGKAESIYGHLSSVLVYPGKEVSAGEMIGVSGHSGKATGEHLHFSLRLDGNAVDPLKFLLSLQVILEKKTEP
ncbi:M23 family metallopeptidase [Pedobacter roseus]|uniref:M23 family metallopeptidase n=1 Tax=Pedobacter roseus TaxID=336820 RepID=A0A7G9QI25_9SPHI|nr:M23 family metallopeptidase [Pedobacter roseus]QNN43000.1 M23 family metallopeptidase [Pedobacter roseus]